MSRTQRSIAAALLALCPVLSPALATTTTRPGEPVRGRMIVALCDADLGVEGFSSRSLGSTVGTVGTGGTGGGRDVMTVVSLPIVEPVTPVAQTETSSSALTPGAALDMTRDGRWAIACEHRKPASAGGMSAGDLAPGSLVHAIDLSQAMAPKVVSSVDLGAAALGLSVHPGGSFVAVVTAQARRQLVLIPMQGGTLSTEPSGWPLLGLDSDEASASSVAWHPSGRALAVTLLDRGEVMFYLFRARKDGSLALAAWGEPVKVGSSPRACRFAPDGRHLIVTDTRWKDGGDEFNPGSELGRVHAVRVGELPEGDDLAPDGPAGHRVLGFADVGIGPIAAAISPDGQRVGIACIRATTDEKVRGGGVWLLGLSRDGALTSLSSRTINATPAGLCFDAGGRHLIVSQLRSFDAGAVDGELAFFATGSGTLEQLPLYMGVGKGPHAVLVVP